MELKTKPDLPRVKDMWNHYWAGEVYKRPLVVATAAKDKNHPVGWPGFNYYPGVHGKYEDQLKAIDHHLENTLYLGEYVPFFGPEQGPDQFAAYCGATLRFKEGSMGTSWVDPVVEDWESFLPVQIKDDHPAWKNALEYSRVLLEHSKGKYIVGTCDLHSNADALSALRTPERLCMDFYDCPQLVEKAMLQMRKLYSKVYDTLYRAGGMNNETGTTGWAPFWCQGKFTTIQCDFICLVSPEISRKYILPALEEEAGFLDHCVFHLDGPGALPHLDDILSIKKIDVIQWVSGAGQPDIHTWVDVFKKCQAAGKGLQIYLGGLETIKSLSRELNPKGVVYCPWNQTKEQVEEIIEWLEKNT